MSCSRWFRSIKPSAVVGRNKVAVLGYALAVAEKNLELPMHGNWNGYLVKALTQLVEVYHVCKSPRLTKATARAMTSQAHRKLPSAEEKCERKRVYGRSDSSAGRHHSQKIT